MFAWPALELTEYERKFVRIYKTGKFPGVLNRRYKITLNSQAIPDQNLPQITLSGNIQIARRSRIYALSFVGNMDRWRLNISNASGTQYTNKSPRGQLDPIVSSMVPGTYGNGLSMGGLPIPYSTDVSPAMGPNFNIFQQTVIGQQPFPLLIEPNWLLAPNETLIFTGTPIDITFTDGEEPPVLFTPPLVLTICAHVWEFPVMGTAPAKERQIL